MNFTRVFFLANNNGNYYGKLNFNLVLNDLYKITFG
jgi:hypothetical protein